jgi:anti-anti-sigma regulatory factor
MKKAEAAGAIFALCGVNEQVREVLDVTGLVPLLTIHPGRSEGLAALSAITVTAAAPQANVPEK